MPAARFRRRSVEWQYGETCIDCGDLKAANATRCRTCWRDNVLRADPRYWGSRTCSDCGGAKDRQSTRCRPCANVLLRGKPRSTPVVVSADHRWRRTMLPRRA